MTFSVHSQVFLVTDSPHLTRAIIRAIEGQLRKHCVFPACHRFDLIWDRTWWPQNQEKGFRQDQDRRSAEEKAEHGEDGGGEREKKEGGGSVSGGGREAFLWPRGVKEAIDKRMREEEKKEEEDEDDYDDDAKTGVNGNIVVSMSGEGATDMRKRENERAGRGKFSKKLFESHSPGKGFCKKRDLKSSKFKKVISKTMKAALERISSSSSSSGGGKGGSGNVMLETVPTNASPNSSASSVIASSAPHFGLIKSKAKNEKSL